MYAIIAPNIHNAERPPVTIRGVDRYIDSLCINREVEATPDQLQQLKSVGANVRQHRGKCPRRPWRLSIDRPRNGVWQRLETICGPNDRVSRVDVAFDVRATHKPDALVIRQWFMQRLQWRRHRPGYLAVRGATAYLAPRRWNQIGFAAYCDRPSRIRPTQACAHFELRLFGSACCARQGIKQTKDVEKLDLRKLLAKQFRLANIKRRKLGTMLLRKQGVRSPESHRCACIGNGIVRMFEPADQESIALTTCEVCHLATARGLPARRFTEPIDLWRAFRQ